MLKTAWFDALSGEAEAALAALPACEMCPHPIYRQLAALPREGRVRIALVSEAGAPVALVALVRRARWEWEPIGNWLFPGPNFPCQPGRHVEALIAIGAEIPVAWWRMPQAPPQGPRIHDLNISPVYRMDDIAGREAFWRSTDYLRHVKNIRNRSRGLELRVGAPEFAEEIAAGAQEKWGGARDDYEVHARTLIAQAREPEGAHVTVALLDNGKLAAGSTNFIHQGALVAGILYTPDEFRRIGAGVRLIDVMFDVAEARGLSAFDMGGGAEYKRKWAPPVGERASFTIAPPALRLARRALGGAKALIRPRAAMAD